MNVENNDGCFVGFFILSMLLGMALLGFWVWVIFELVTWITSK